MASAGGRARRKPRMQRLSTAEHALWSRVGTHNLLVCLSVAAETRRAGRIVLSPAKLPVVLWACEELGLSVYELPLGLVHTESVAPSVQHEARWVDRDDDSSAAAVVVIGRAQALTYKLAELEVLGDHCALGQFYGYPECCVEGFSNGDPSAWDRNPFGFTQLEHLLPELNPLVQPSGNTSLVFHFPCTYTCEASLALWNRHASILAGHLGPRFQAHRCALSGLSMYGPQCGLVHIREWRQTGRGTLIPLLSHRCDGGEGVDCGMNLAHKVIRIRGPEDFDVGTSTYRDGLDRIGFFGSRGLRGGPA